MTTFFFLLYILMFILHNLMISKLFEFWVNNTTLKHFQVLIQQRHHYYRYFMRIYSRIPYNDSLV